MTTPTIPALVPRRNGLGASRVRVALALLALSAPAPALGGAQVYRCGTPDGAIEFRQGPCAEGASGDTIVIEDQRTGWTLAPAGPDGAPGDVPPKPKRKPVSNRPSAASTARERAERQCGRKRQQVEDIDRRLRQGTSGRENEDLRHRRNDLEDFLFEHCR